MRPLRRRHSLLAALLLLSACASPPRLQPTATSQPWQASMAWLQNCPSWHLEGKMGVRLEQQAGSLYVDWQDDGQHWDLQASGPLGQGAVHLYGDAGAAVLDRGREGRSQADSPEDLLAQQLRLRAPISALRLWLRGRPEHLPAQARLDREGRLQELDDGVYRIEYQHDPQDARHLPRRIHVQGPQLNMTLVIHRWTLPANCSS